MKTKPGATMKAELCLAVQVKPRGLAGPTLRPETGNMACCSFMAGGYRRARRELEAAIPPPPDLQSAKRRMLSRAAP